MTRMIKETTERQHSAKNANKSSNEDDQNESDYDFGDKDSLKNLSPKDIYMRVASNLELIELYAWVNSKLIEENPRNLSALFRRATNSLIGIRDTLDQFQIKVQFQHVWFSTSKFVSYWSFFNRFNIETDKKDQAINVKKFFIRYLPPEIMQTESNLRLLQRLIMLTADFSECVNQSIGRNCCLCSCSDQLFGRNDQAKLILKKQFEGMQYSVQGPDGNTLDCMFFPCTQKEEVVLYSQMRNSSERVSLEYLPKYTSKPTVLMCNPNALIYQQMVIGPNAYWLNFFLKRDINVICWNYRGYGQSTISWTNFLYPSQSKRDSERVLAGSIEILQLKGKIGVYGRSIGGITANHLAATYKDLIEILIIDRSLNELQGVAESKLRGSATITIFKQFTNGWVCKNSENYLKADQTYKIITCDPLDDTVDQFVSTMSGIGSIHSKQDYQTRDYQLFYQSLLFLIDLEEAQYANHEWQYNEYEDLLLSCVEKTEEMIENQQTQQFQQVVTNNDANLFHSNAGRLRASSPLICNVDFLKQRRNLIEQQNGPFFNVLYVLTMIICDLSAATLKLRDVIGVLKKPTFNDFKLFLQLAEVFGSGYDDDVDYSNANLRLTQTHSQSLILQLQRIVHVYDLAIFAINQQKSHSLIGGLAVYHEEFQKMLQFQQRMFQDMIVIQSKNKQDVNNDFKKTIEGHLVYFTCGHRGQPSRIEEKRVSRLLRKSGFIPMLEEIQLPQKKQMEIKKVEGKIKTPLSKSQEQNIKIVGADNQPQNNQQQNLSKSERLKVNDLPGSQINHDGFEREIQDSDIEDNKEELIDKFEADLNESLNNSVIEDEETKEFLKDKLANSVQINFQATDTMFFGMDQTQNHRLSYIPVFAEKSQQLQQSLNNQKQRNMSVAQFGSSKKNDIYEKETNQTKSRNMSVISQSKQVILD